MADTNNWPSAACVISISPATFFHLPIKPAGGCGLMAFRKRRRESMLVPISLIGVLPEKGSS
ncbi:hypothetical protein D3C71_2104820 [compost metagenome]